MFCKNCGAEIDKEAKTCPACGVKTEANDKAMKIVVAVACLLVLAAVLVVVVLKSLDSGLFSNDEETTPSETVQETEEETTSSVDYPSYSADDAAVEANRDMVIATVGDYDLTGAQLQLQYWFQVYSYQEKYYDYIAAGYLSLDVTKPLSQQACAEDPSMSWEQYFLKKTFTTWQSYAIMNMLADREGFQLDENFLDDLKASHLEDAKAKGFEDVDSYILDMMNNEVSTSATADDYWEYMTFFNRATAYFGDWYAKATPTADEMEAYYAENEKALVEAGAGKDVGYGTVDVRHILIMVNEDSDAAWKLAESEAQRILQEYKDGGATEEVFAELANKYSEDSGSNTNGGLYSGVTSGQMVEVFNDWILDGSRQPGDTDILKADYYYQGYHIMYWVKGDLAWESTVMQAMLTERSSAMLSGGMEQWPIEKFEENIKLGTPTFGK